MALIRIKIIVFFLIILAGKVFSQDNYVTFGLQVEPLIPSDLIRSNDVKAFEQGVEFSADPLSGFGYGANISFHFHPRMAIQSGINYLKRDSKITSVEPDGFTLDLQYTIDNFEIPLTFNYYVRLAEKLYMDGALGFSFQFLPGEVKAREFRQNNTGGYEYDFSQLSARNYWVMPAFRGGFGFEYRTEKSGSFYVGPVFRLFSTLYYTQIIYVHNNINISNLVIEPVSDYFSVTIRYTFAH